MKFALLGILAAGIVTVHASPINLIANGSFELGGTVTANHGSWIVYNPITGWGSTGNVEVQSNGIYSPASVAADGTHWVELDSHNNNPGSVAITQTVSTVAGLQYDLSFAFAGRPGESASQNVLDVSINGAVTRYSKGSTNPGLNWNYLSLSFVGTGSDVIYFADGGLATPGINNTYGTLLDDVSVIQVQAVPEPTSMGLLGIGMLGMAFAVRRRAGRKA